MKPLALEENEVLFGADPTEGIVAVEPLGEEQMRLFVRQGERLLAKDQPFRPFLLVEKENLMEGYKRPFQVEQLTGTNAYRCLILFESWGDCRKAKTYLQKQTGESPSSLYAPYLFLSDPVHQFLLLTGKALFKGLPFKDLHRLALDIETACTPGYEFPNPRREGDRIISIALMDNHGYEEVFFGQEMGEKEMLMALGERISRLDPDVLEGHNLFNFDLEYIVARARMHRVDLQWGRDGSRPRIRRSRFNVAERTIDYTRMEIFGRHVIDTLFLLQYYDVTARELESYGLKAAAQHFGLSTENRTYIEADRIQWAYDHEPDLLKSYNLDDVRETLALSELLGHSFFLQARIFPYSFQNIFVRGNATKINALFLREYLRQRASVPRPEGGGAVEGGYTDVFVKGVVHHVVHCDVASLYPSIMLSFDLKPSSDNLGVFLPLLKDLKDFRLEAKGRAQRARSPQERDYHQALQQTFKILINSFYGYLGTELHQFSDPEVAAEVTRQGRDLIRQMLSWLKKEGATPIEMDTDGIYYVPPPGIKTEKEAKAMVERLAGSLPEGIEVEMDAQYEAMFSYKSKNYALLDKAGKMVIRGSALRSRGMEKYLREFLSAMIRLLLEGKGKEVHQLLGQYLSKLESHEIEISLLGKTETLGESLDTYRQKVKAKKRNPAAPYELALASGREYRAGDQISYYVTGTKKRVRVYENSRLVSSYDPSQPDENIAYYKEKLLALFKKFQEFVPPD
ncbi:MAG: DNA polymerase domain-containing protein [Desulfobacteraceae bacterium]|jgi:DNA polymerase elongation subunit (family B)